MNLVTGKLKQVNLFGNDQIGSVDVTWNGSISTYRKQYYIKDHLGSIRVSKGSDGTILSARNYFSYGETQQEYINSSYNTKYKFTGKERDTETGLDYFGARFYNSELGRWYSVDPMAAKYPGWSPYNYCMGNPVRVYDPDGMRIRIATGEIDADGNDIYLDYSAGMEYTGNNEFVKKAIDALNGMNFDMGAYVLSSLIESSEEYNFENKPSAKKGTIQFKETESGGVILAEAIMTSSLGGNINDVAHELFHAYQADNHRPTETSNAEVEAYLFGNAVGANAAKGFGKIFWGQATEAGENWANAMNKMMFAPEFNCETFVMASRNFAKGNPWGYRTHKYDATYQPLINRFFPLQK